MQDVDSVITRHVALAMGAAAVPVPLADIAAVTWVQVDLVKRLATRHGVDFDAARAKALVLALAGATAARVGGSLVKAVPGGGFLIGSATQLALAGASTYAIGKVVHEQFEAVGALDAPDVERLRGRFDTHLERGREIARDLRERVTFDDEVDPALEARERLERLHRAGILTEAEFRRLTDDPPS